MRSRLRHAVKPGYAAGVVEAYARSWNHPPAEQDPRLAGNADFRDGYAEGFLDAIAAIRAAVGEPSPQHRPHHRDDGCFAQRFLERQRQQRLDEEQGR